ncbi:hypothetical protein BU23DRAFT_555908 [Bimuria novae-zelandiae CBS 107.79]|uniref:Mid2 domain-containing protein n=1 Tax=Bimuria novae-zelandiae CBS 107.79 TaxID=1447943 RepID=A0A6A5V1Q4_9PLEO|nr:hypothetical protein BU23DRAFT_555908 [Bimuria novae-zelandiae CBS 107.79]
MTMGLLAGPKLSGASLLSLIVFTLPTTQASSLFSRSEETCGGKPGLQQCGGDLPASFCCGQDTTCTTVNSTIQAVICCPKGKDCSSIHRVPCDITQYNATLHPDNQIHFADTKDIELPECGDSCCPLGYKCNGGMCISLKETPTSTTLLPTSTPTSPASASQTSEPAEPLPAANSGFDGKSFAAGFFPGILIGALAVILIIWLIRKRRNAKASRYSGDFGHVARTISDPIYDPQHARTDFIRQNSQSFTSTPSVQKNIGTRALGSVGGLTPRIKSMWDRTPKLGIGVWSGPPQTPTLQQPPPAVRAGDPLRSPYRTPGHTPSPHRSRSRRKRSRARRPDAATRSNSSETIDVLMPAPSFLAPPKAPGMRENRMTADSGHTTFTKLMERAGYGEDSRESVRNFMATPAHAR